MVLWLIVLNWRFSLLYVCIVLVWLIISVVWLIDGCLCFCFGFNRFVFGSCFCWFGFVSVAGLGVLV